MENCCGTDLNFRTFSPTFQYSKGGLTLKNVSNTCEPEFAKRTKDKKVLKPPFSTAGPIFCKAFLLRSIFVPIKKITTLEPSFPKIHTFSYLEMLRIRGLCEQDSQRKDQY